MYEMYKVGKMVRFDPRCFYEQYCEEVVGPPLSFEDWGENEHYGKEDFGVITRVINESLYEIEIMWLVVDQGRTTTHPLWALNEGTHIQVVS